MIAFGEYDANEFVQKCTMFEQLRSIKTMQISRHWRLNSQRYRLQGVRYQNGEVSLQSRPTPLSNPEIHSVKSKNEKVSLKATS